MAKLVVNAEKNLEFENRDNLTTIEANLSAQ